MRESWQEESRTGALSFKEEGCECCLEATPKVGTLHFSFLLEGGLWGNYLFFGDCPIIAELLLTIYIP